MRSTGERMYNHPKSATYTFHIDRYIFAAQFTHNKKVLDIACGSGYGTAYLSSYTASITGADIDRETIRHCKRTYPHIARSFQMILPNQQETSFVQSFDIVISFETLEHTTNGANFLQHLLSYVRPGGRVILSTPNNFAHIHPPKNPFHVYEYDILELETLIHKIAPQATITLYGQYPSGHSRSTPIHKLSRIKSIIASIIRNIYLFDLRYTKILRLIEHTNIYKKIGSLQYDHTIDFSIYPINPTSEFIDPFVTIAVIKL